LGRLQYIPFSLEIENAAILIRRQYKLKLPDVVIAASAKCLKLELLTLNQVHVENCSFSPHPQPLSQRARGAGKAFKVPLPRERDLG